MDEREDDARRSGYLSEHSKKKFTITAGVLGALFFAVQFVGPMVAMLAMMPTMMSGNTIVTHALEGSAPYRGELYVVETSRTLGNLKDQASRTRLLKIGSGGLEEVASLEGGEPRLLADGERLWLISSARMAVFDGRQVQPLQVPETLGDISRPFLYEGAPAVVESRPDGERLQVWKDGGWKTARVLSGVGGACCTQLLATGGGLLAFREKGQSVFARHLDRDEESWTVVASKTHHWYAFEKDGEPAVVWTGLEGLGIVVRDGQRWMTTALDSTGTTLLAEVAAFQTRKDGPVVVVSTGFPGSLKVRTWDGTRFVDERRFGGFWPFPRGMMLMMWLPHAGTMVLSLVLAVILSSLMRAHRIAVYVHGGSEVPHASLTRRALSQLLDALILAGPGAVLFLRMFGDFEWIFSQPSVPFRLFGLMAGALGWSLLVLVGFSLTEAFWGVTPGKWVMGIRVVGTDLRPCGFGRAVIRNVLKFVDGFFNFLVGMLMVAYTPDWQRLGDLAARTVVIRTPRGGLRGLRDAVR